MDKSMCVVLLASNCAVICSLIAESPLEHPNVNISSKISDGIFIRHNV